MTRPSSNEVTTAEILLLIHALKELSVQIIPLVVASRRVVPEGVYQEIRPLVFLFDPLLQALEQAYDERDNE
jgi:hypothetical protein